MTVISADQLSKSFGSVKAVDGLTLNVDEGSITALVGPNGAGKTTTIKMILGLLRPDSGTVTVFGESPWDNPSIRTLIGVVHEKACFPSHQKTLDYLERACRIFGVPATRALEVLGMVNLTDASDRPIKALSAGMLQKFAIAHALVNSPRLLVADEMTANLDPQARSNLLDLVLQLHKDQNVTYLLSSHILPELSRVCDSVAIMNQGKVWASGKLSDLYNQYAAGTIRISTDKPQELATEIRKLPYVEKCITDLRGIFVKVKPGDENLLYETAPRLATSVSAKIFGIETGSSSLEELYKQIVTPQPKGD
jgi:ABC-2 type transport system ATP-binding protein